MPDISPNNTPIIVDEKNLELDGADTSSDNYSTISSPFNTSKIRIDPKNISLDIILERIRNDEIVLDPDFQRHSDIWKEKAQSRLIESLLLRIPIPAFYFDATDDNKWLVVDGLQRLTAIRRFVIDQTLALSHLEFLGNEYNGAHFNTLPRALQRIIKETVLVAYLIAPGTPAEVKFNVFQRINTGGLPLSSQEIRHALNQGPITQKLADLAMSTEFIQATTGSISHKRMDDRECITRFIVFTLLPPETYDKDDYDAFLNAGMKKANALTGTRLQDLCNNFLRVMRYAHRIFGNYAFRKRYEREDARFPINKALFEAWTVNLGLLTDKQLNMLVERKKLLEDAFMQLMSTREFENAVTQGTGSIARVKYRYSKINTIIHEVLHA